MAKLLAARMPTPDYTGLLRPSAFITAAVAADTVTHVQSGVANLLAEDTLIAQAHSVDLTVPPMRRAGPMSS